MTAPILTQIHCEHCGVFFNLPELSAEKRNRIVDLLRTNQFAEAIRLLPTSHGIELVDAKSIVYHITRKQSICHRCRTALPSTGQVVCPKCKSLNLDW
jgi:uncharacterized paraquat-inducible protein A